MVRTVPKKSLLLAVALTAVIMVIYYSRREGDVAAENKLAAAGARRGPRPASDHGGGGGGGGSGRRRGQDPPREVSTSPQAPAALLPGAAKRADTCPVGSAKRSRADMETTDILPTLNFDADWMERREFWNDKMQRRYEKRRKEMWSKVPLRVFVMPHSHNDPGWLKTFDAYFHTTTKQILNNIVDKLTKYKDMTFVWTEISFLSMWYESAHDARKANLQHLLEEGRFEILTGGWVMTDEANVDTFGMVDQLIEGHQWMQNYLNVTARSSWSVDPFGHGGTFPYILKASGLDGMVIMRIHYAWKEWFAREQQGDFLWQQQWDQSGRHSILCHNFPYDIYSIKGSCGPHPQTCLEFNYRRVQGDYSEYSARYTPVHSGNVKERAELLLEQYGKTGSLFPHNVVLVPLGDDFTYNHEVEFDQQHANYKMLMDFINGGDYDAEVSFGTLTDYFNEVRRRTSSFGTLNGDFFVYSDIFTEGRPAYWSGYFTTRPFMKSFSRELSASLRAAEILFTWSYHSARQSSDAASANALASLHPALVDARRQHALFQHHDAITGTAKQAVMHDYALKMWGAIKSAWRIQKVSFQLLMRKEDGEEKHGGQVGGEEESQVSRDFDRPAYQVPATPRPLRLPRPGDEAAVLVFNPLAEAAREAVTVFVQTAEVCVRDAAGNPIRFQMNPTWNASGFFRLDISFLELTFVATLQPLSINKFVVSRCKGGGRDEDDEQTTVYCLRCPNTPGPAAPFSLAPKPEGAIQLENSELVLTFDESSHLLKSVNHKRSGRTEDVKLQFAAYPTAQFRSGAYLFKTDSRGEEKVAVFGPSDLVECVVTSGTVFSEVTLLFESGQSKQEPATFAHTVRLYHTNDGVRNRGIYVENNFDFGGSENHNDVDLFMRFVTGIKNGRSEKQPEFYTDMSGFQMQKRTMVRQINIEGNYYPISTMTYMEDEEARLTLVVDHAMGAASWQRGWLEVMVDRRSTFDDARGMGEGVLDNRQTKHRYWLLYEPKRDRTEKDADPGGEELSLPSQVASALSRRLSYPPVHYVSSRPRVFRARRSLLRDPSSHVPCDLHLLNLRTLSDPAHPDQAPDREALMVLHAQGSDCRLNSVPSCQDDNNDGGVGFEWRFADFNVRRAARTILTGVEERKGKKGSSPELRTDLRDLRVERMTLESVKLEL